MSKNTSWKTADLPVTFRRYSCPKEEYVAILFEALQFFTTINPDDVRVQDIAHRMNLSEVHPMLRDKKQLYDESLRFAFRLLWPHPQDIEVEKLTPAAAVRTLVRTTYRRFQQYPQAVRFLTQENLLDYAHIHDRSGVLESSPVILQVDRVLMHGQDYGAFRPGISAEDVYALMISLCSFPLTQGHLFRAHYGVDTHEKHNITGLEHLACDTVLAFLTTSIPTEQGSSYTHSSPNQRTPGSVAASLYSSESTPMNTEQAEAQHTSHGDEWSQ